jgi:hypothetical protein
LDHAGFDFGEPGGGAVEDDGEGSEAAGVDEAGGEEAGGTLAGGDDAVGDGFGGDVRAVDAGFEGELADIGGFDGDGAGEGTAVEAAELIENLGVEAADDAAELGEGFVPGGGNVVGTGGVEGGGGFGGPLFRNSGWTD